MSEERTATSSRTIATAGLVLIGLLAAFHVAFGRTAGTFDLTLTGVLGLIGTLVFVALFAGIGWMIVVRQPGNTIGWILLVTPLIATLAAAVGDYTSLALVVDPGSLPFGVAFAWLDRWLIVPALYVFVLIFLLFPDGRLPSRRWRPVLWLAVAAPTLTIVSFALTPARLTGAFSDLTSVNVMNPLGVSIFGNLMSTLTQVGGLASVLAGVLSVFALVMRHRSATGEVRQQTRWLAFVGIAALIGFAIAIVTGITLGDDSQLSGAVFLTSFFVVLLGVPVACGIAILRYRLYDLDVVIRKTVLYAVLAGLLLAVFGAVTLVTTSLFASASNGRLDLIAGIVVGALIWPLRRVATRIADRVVYGRRATPYEAMTEFAGRVGETYDTEDVLPRMAQILAGATGASSARVLLAVHGELQEAASTGSTEGAEERFAVRHQGEELGALAVTMPANDPMTPAKAELVRDLASQAGPVLRNVRLLEELRASRQRLVAAQDEERRKIERNLHDGVQQQLVALNVQLGLLAKVAGRDPAAVPGLASDLQGRATDALEDLRDLARGIYPPLLADRGLPAALEAQARKAAVPTTVETDGVGRYPQDVEATVYFCTLEALNNVAKYAGATAATIRLAQTDGHLSFEVADDGRGFDPERTGYGTGLQGMTDRLDAIGGTLNVRSAVGAGTTVVGTLSVAERRP
ncbi:MAG TPA: sensor histidine kinase [Actinomycetota bacterium]|nr:sensor histidine kinase [Actinomycetota bacterium]